MVSRSKIMDKINRANSDANPPSGDGAPTGDTPLAFGICKIITNGADGTYTITEQVYDSVAGTYGNADGGFSAIAAREVNDCSLLQVNDPAVYFETQTKNGETEYTLICTVPDATRDGSTYVLTSTSGSLEWLEAQDGVCP
jgi:hypothetical protein